MKYPPIYIICHRNDYFLAQIAISSIRYYYPTVEINLIKDEISGKFDTKELEKYYKVNIVDLSKIRYGWTSAKIFLLLSKKLKGEKIFLLDADIVFVGKVLDKLSPSWKEYDLIVNPEYSDTPESQNFSQYYYDYQYFKRHYPSLEFPGFTFNTGNMMVSIGLIKNSEIKKYFNFNKYPYWTKIAEKYLPTRDQSLLNVLLPIKAKKGLINWKQIPLMLWFAQDGVQDLSIRDIEKGKKDFLIHWAGGKKTPFVLGMRRGDILLFFQKHYYSLLPCGGIRYYLNLFKERGSKTLLVLLPQKSS